MTTDSHFGACVLRTSKVTTVSHIGAVCKFVMLYKNFCSLRGPVSQSDSQSQSLGPSGILGSTGMRLTDGPLENPADRYQRYQALSSHLITLDNDLITT